MDNQNLIYIGLGVGAIVLLSVLGRGSSSSSVIRGGTDPTAANLALGLSEQQTQRSSVIAQALTTLGVSRNETDLGKYTALMQADTQRSEIAARSTLGMRELAVRENLGFQELAVRSQLGNKSLDYTFATDKQRNEYDYRSTMAAIEKDRELGLGALDVQRYGITKQADIRGAEISTQNTQNWLSALNPGSWIGGFLKGIFGG